MVVKPPSPWDVQNLVAYRLAIMLHDKLDALGRVLTVEEMAYLVEAPAEIERLQKLLGDIVAKLPFPPVIIRS